MKDILKIKNKHQYQVELTRYDLFARNIYINITAKINITIDLPLNTFAENNITTWPYKSENYQILTMLCLDIFEFLSKIDCREHHGLKSKIKIYRRGGSIVEILVSFR